MLWRLRKLDWRYAIGELIIVTAGVLIALAIDQWNSDRLDRAEEILILERLLVDLQADRDSIEFGLSLLPAKERSLGRVYEALSSSEQTVEDPTAFLDDIAQGAIYGWVQVGSERDTVFDELLSSGRFGLIRNNELRASISDYYAVKAGAFERISERETEYPALSYQLVPRINEHSGVSIDPEYTGNQLDVLVARVLDTRLEGHLIAEINFSRFVAGILNDQRDSTDAMSDEVRVYLDSVR